MVLLKHPLFSPYCSLVICVLFQMLTNAMRLLLYVTAMPTAPILVDRISVPAGQAIQAMEKHAKVGLKMSG